MKGTSRSLCYPVYVVVVFHFVKQSAKPLGFLLKFLHLEFKGFFLAFLDMGPYGWKI